MKGHVCQESNWLDLLRSDWLDPLIRSVWLVVLCARVLVSRTAEMNQFKLSSNSRGQMWSSCVGWVGTNAIGMLTPLGSTIGVSRMWWSPEAMSFTA